MTCDVIPVDRSIYESLQTELAQLRQVVKERKEPQISQPLSHNYRQISLFIEYTPAAIAIFDKQMRYLSASRRWREDYRLGDRELIGHCHYDIFPHLPQSWQEIHQRCLAGAVEHCEEDRIYHTDGSIDWLKWEIHPWYQDDGEIGGIIIFTEVITNRKCAEMALAESERRLRDIANNLPGAIFQFTNSHGTWRVDYISDFIYELAGITTSEIIEDLDNFFALIHPEDVDCCLASINHAITQNVPWKYEGRLIKPNGEIRWWQGESTPTKNEQGEMIFCGVLLDITARKQAEISLRELNEELEVKVQERTIALHQSEARLKRLADNVPGMLYEFRLASDGTTSFPYASSGCRDIIGIEPEQIQADGSLIYNYIHPQDIPKIQSAMSLSAQTLENYQSEWRIKTTTGERKSVKAVARPEPQPDGAIIWYGCLFDISEQQAALRDRKQALAKLKEQEEFLRTIYEGVPQIIFVVDVMENGELRYASWNSSAEIASGISQAEIAGKTLEYFHGEVEAKEVSQRYQRCIDSETSISYEEFLTINNQSSWWITTLNPLKNREGQVYRIVGTTLDITGRKKSEQALQESQHFIQRIADSSPNLLYIFDLEEKRNVYANQELYKFLGYSQTDFENMGENLIPNVTYKDDLPKVLDHWQKLTTIADGEIVEIEYRMQKANGELCWLYSRDTVFNRNNNGQVKQILGVSADITERKQAEILLQQQATSLQNALSDLKRTQIQLIHSEKMSSLGNMVAGVAHEINNPVNFIHGNLSPASEYIEDILRLLDLYAEHFPEPPLEIQEEIEAIDLDFLKVDLMKLVKSMRIGTDRIREIVISLRNFSRLDEAEVKEVNIHEGIDSTLMILHNRLKSKPNHPEIAVIRNYATLPLIECYPGQLNQVFMNILSNAIDALEDPRLGNKSREIHITTELVNHDTISIRIADNGIGISEEIISKLFDPFFTTKDVGKGTGLGLSISYQIIVDRHQGKLSCHSLPDGGAEFVIEIPILQTQPQKLATANKS
ncbi:PAS/PAC sensor signal transduction histidine kinase [Richelia sinica FACHB-800]|uniref:histidine kinase n=1 Tax=Richelia sinica FACHB-800 TaxID=1357546 RepID=A0A975Y4U7_9NOST|nr:PAS domain S-box protein [Richelia sinica]QXE23551.1 PAS/PAC sensor signal transduction histidine kinase [Richelia sinica FACHB-800]